jgi:hypothetical protein
MRQLKNLKKGWVMETNKDIIRDQWTNLGIAFAVKSKIKNADPEATLILSLKEFHEDRKLLKLVISWLDEFGDLVHVERLKVLAKGLNARDQAWLGLIAEYMTNVQKDHRFKKILNLVKIHLGKPSPFFEQPKFLELHFEREISKGSNPIGNKFGLKITSSDLKGDPKKLKDKNSAIMGNLWLRMRLLFGCSWRADVCTVILLEMANNYYQAKKVLGCSIETAHRNWKSLKESNVLELFRL